MVKTISRIQKCHFDLPLGKTTIQHIFEGIVSNIPYICFIQPWVNQSIQVLTIISCCSEHFRQNLGEHISNWELSMNLSNAADLQTACEKSSLNGKISDGFHARYLVTSSQQQSQQQAFTQRVLVVACIQFDQHYSSLKMVMHRIVPGTSFV